MKNLEWPAEPDKQRDRVLAVVDEAANLGFLAALSFVAVKRAGQQHAIFGRVDLTPPHCVVNPLDDRFGDLSALGEVLPASTFAERLRAAMTADVLIVAGSDVHGCALGRQWSARSWTAQIPPDAVAWPCTVLSTADLPTPQPSSTGVLMGASGTVYSDLYGLLKGVSRLEPFFDGVDARKHAIHIVMRPYVGRISGIRTDHESITVTTEVSADGKWKLAAFAGNGLVGTKDAAFEVRIPYTGSLHRLKVSLLRDGVPEDEWAMQPGVPENVRWCTPYVHDEPQQEAQSDNEEPMTPTDAVHVVTKLLDGFPRLARSLASRDRGREPVELRDEYDVQWLLTAVLRAHFARRGHSDRRSADRRTARADSRIAERPDVFAAPCPAPLAARSGRQGLEPIRVSAKPTLDGCEHGGTMPVRARRSRCPRMDDPSVHATAIPVSTLRRDPHPAHALRGRAARGMHAKLRGEQLAHGHPSQARAAGAGGQVRAGWTCRARDHGRVAHRHRSIPLAS